MALLQTDRLTKAYGGRTVVAGVSLEVAFGRGGGPAWPERGGQDHHVLHVRRADAARLGHASRSTALDVTADPIYVRARKGLAYLPQEASIFRGLTVEQNVLAILETLKLDATQRRARCKELLAELSLTHLARSKAYTLSGGERRRVEITRALVNNPKFILLDEPFAGIDPIAVSDIQKIIFHLKNRGIGVLITDHNVRETLKITDRAHIVHAGSIFKSGTPGELAADEEVKRIYLGTDFRLD